MWKKLFGHRSAPEVIGVETIRTGASIRLVTRGLPEHGVRDLELVQVPADLEREATTLLTLLAQRASVEKPSRDGATLAGALLDATQTAIHIVTLRVAAESIVPGARELFRVVDFNERVDAGFPVRVVATHLALQAGATRSKKERERLARRSIELFAGSPPPGDDKERFDRGENVENFLGWEALGDVLFERGLFEEARAALTAATQRCPAWAADFAAHVRAHAPGSTDPRMRFWLDFSDRDA